MKKVIGNIWAILFVLCIGCNDDDNYLPEVKPEASGTISVGDNTYGWVRYGGLDWMTDNFKGGQPYYEQTIIDDWEDEVYLIDCFREQAAIDWDNYGNLYTYEEAVENAPDGWRLPTDEDWKKLEQAMGMSVADADALGLRGTIEGDLLLQDKTGTGISLRLGGYVLVNGRPAELRHLHLREYGYYWTATQTETSSEVSFPTIYFRKVSCHSSQIERNATRIVDSNYETNYPKYMSVRYVRDAH